MSAPSEGRSCDDESGIWLEACLAPLGHLLASQDVTDIHINRPGEVWVEALGAGPRLELVPELSDAWLQRLARQIAAHSAQGVSREHPLLAAALPTGERVQVILPPATRGHVAFSLRKHLPIPRELGDFAASPLAPPDQSALSFADGVADSDTVALLRRAVREKRNILISGGTSSGKTTFLNALMREISPDERLIAIEDTPELQIGHANALGLIAVRGQLGEAAVTAEDLLTASLRMRPDRIMLGEVRGPEAMTFLRAINTGHPGSMCTIHADSPEGAIDQLVMLALQAGSPMRWEDIDRYVRRTIHLIVQLGLAGGNRVISAIKALP